MRLRRLAGVAFVVLFFAAVLILGIAAFFLDDITEMLRQLGAGTQQPVESLPPDMEAYFALKNRSCETLSGDFLIMTEEYSTAWASGIVPDTPEVRGAAGLVMQDYDYNATTKTYVRNSMLKVVSITPGGNLTTIWKDGRIYECRENCTMRLLSQGEADALRSRLERMRTSCAYFGKTRLPDSVSTARLLEITKAGVSESGGQRCVDFTIHGNASYASSLLSSPGLDEDQRALLWAVAHFDGPVRECLDERSGITVLRNLSLDLTGAYIFDYSPGGYMKATQWTRLLYFTDSVPESFFSLPKED